MNNLEILTRMEMAPWIFKSTALIGKPRHVGGNQFRHNMATMAILIDYGYIDPILLKAAVIHDLIEDVPETSINDLLMVDSDAEEVVALVKEVTKLDSETKAEYLISVRQRSKKAKILKCADRISNLTDLHWGIFDAKKVRRYLKETEKFIIPIAEQVDSNMLFEMKDLIRRRREMLKTIGE